MKHKASSLISHATSSLWIGPLTLNTCHEWSYNVMCHDLLELKGNKYSYEIMNGSRKERKEVLLEEHDPIWVELRDLFIADASLCLSDKMQMFTNKNILLNCNWVRGRDSCLPETCRS